MLQGLFLFLLLGNSSIAAQLDEALSVAKKTNLAQESRWLALGHYQKVWLSSAYKSQADGETFFLAPDGKTNPLAELEQTLKSFFLPQDPAKPNDHAICLFPARYRYLKAKLNLDLKDPNCPEFFNFVRSLSARGASLVFSSYYLNNPSSAFGHTFLRLKKDTSVADTERAELLDYGINYAAVVTTSNAVLYAMSGIFGWFQGTFTKLPFYYKVREYSDFESRDLWTYDLNMTQDQIDDLVSHLWELGHTYFDYFYFTENCSYHMLSVLDSVNPDWKLTDKLSYAVIPSETIRAIQAVPGFVKSIQFRPSNRRILENRYNSLNSEEKNFFYQMIDTNQPQSHGSLSKESAKNSYDAVIDYIDFKKAKELIDGESPAAKNKQEFLISRSELGIVTPQMIPQIPFNKQPHLGHLSSRFQLSGGYSNYYKGNSNFTYRGAFHDLLDSLDGYPDHAAMEMFELGIKVPYEKPSVKFEKIEMIRIATHTPMHSLYSPLSWKLNVGGVRVLEDHCNHCFAGRIEFGGGLTVAPLRDQRNILFLLIAQQIALAPHFPMSKFRLSAGPNLGTRISFSNSIGLLVQSQLYYHLGFRSRWTFQHEADFRAGLTKVPFAFGAKALKAKTEEEIQAYVNFYF